MMGILDGIAGRHRGRRAKGIITRMKVNSQGMEGPSHGLPPAGKSKGDLPDPHSPLSRKGKRGAGGGSYKASLPIEERRRDPPQGNEHRFRQSLGLPPKVVGREGRDRVGRGGRATRPDP